MTEINGETDGTRYTTDDHHNTQQYKDENLPGNNNRANDTQACATPMLATDNTVDMNYDNRNDNNRTSTVVRTITSTATVLTSDIRSILSRASRHTYTSRQLETTLHTIDRTSLTLVLSTIPRPG